MSERKQLSPEHRQNAITNLSRMDKYVQAALTGILANPAYNQAEGRNWMAAKKLTPETLAVSGGVECMIQLDKFLKGEVGGESRDDFAIIHIQE